MSNYHYGLLIFSQEFIEICPAKQQVFNLGHTPAQSL